MGTGGGGGGGGGGGQAGGGVGAGGGGTNAAEEGQSLFSSHLLTMGRETLDTPRPRAQPPERKISALTDEQSRGLGLVHNGKKQTPAKNKKISSSLSAIFDDVGFTRRRSIIYIQKRFFVFVFFLHSTKMCYLLP